MHLSYAHHAILVRMVEREVSEEDVRRVIQEGRAARAQPGSRKKVLRLRGKRVGVAYRQTGPDSYFVITVTVD